MFYGYEKDPREKIVGKNTLSYSVDVLGGLTYQFYIRAVTVKPGENASITIDVPEYGRFSFFFNVKTLFNHKMFRWLLVHLCRKIKVIRCENDLVTLREASFNRFNSLFHTPDTSQYLSSELDGQILAREINFKKGLNQL